MSFVGYLNSNSTKYPIMSFKCHTSEHVPCNMELDPKYVDVIINRWEQYTGQKAVLISE